MFVPTIVLAGYSIFVNFMIKDQKALSFEKIIANKPNTNILLGMEILCWISLVSVQIFMVSMVSYVFLLL